MNKRIFTIKFKDGLREEPFLKTGKELFNVPKITDEIFIKLFELRITIRPKAINDYISIGENNFDFDRYLDYLDYRQKNPYDSSSNTFLELKYGYIKKTKKSNPYKIDDVMKKYNIDYSEACDLVNKRKLNTSQSLEGFINRYGPELGNKKYKEFCEKNSYRNTLEGKIDLFGVEVGNKKYKVQNEKNSHSSSLIGYIEKYGDEGINLFYEINSKRAYGNSYDGLVSKFGKYKADDIIKKRTFCSSYDGLVSKFGKDKADDIIKKRVVYFNDPISYYVKKGFNAKMAQIITYNRHSNYKRKEPFVSSEEISQRINDIKENKEIQKNGEASIESLILFNKLIIETEKLDIIEYFVGLGNGKKEYRIHDNGKLYRYDFCIPELDIIIEYDGSAFHPDRALSEKDLLKWHNPFGVNGLIQLEKDLTKEKVAKKFGFTTYIIVRDNSQETLEYLLKEIKCVLKK